MGVLYVSETMWSLPASFTFFEPVLASFREWSVPFENKKHGEETTGEQII